jgi:hypothetical protein
MVQREQSRSDPNNDNQSRSMVSTSTNPKIKVYALMSLICHRVFANGTLLARSKIEDENKDENECIKDHLASKS